MSDEILNIKGLDKAEVLAVLFNASKPQGMGFMHYDPAPMTREQAQRLLDAGQTNFEYLRGRVMKISLSGDELNTGGYDMDNGQGAAQHALSALLNTGQTNPQTVQDTHAQGTRASADSVKAKLHEGSRIENGKLYMGLGDNADILGPKVDRAVKKLDELNDHRVIGLEDCLTDSERVGVNEFYARLKGHDFNNVKDVLYSVNSAAEVFSSAETRHMGWRHGKDGRAFFLLYLIGGNLTKPGERPDIDLLVATNYDFDTSEDMPRMAADTFEPADIFWDALTRQFKDRAEIKLEGEMPDNYNMGSVEGKCLIRLRPRNGKPIDICYVRDNSANEEGFVKKDIGPNGEQLPRLALYRDSRGLQQMRLHW